MISHKIGQKRARLYILLTNTGSVPTKIIGLYTRAPFNHVSIGFDIKLDRLYSFGRKRMRNPLLGGFVRENTTEGIYAYFRNTYCSIYELDVDLETYKRLKLVIKSFEKDKDKYRYNFIGLLGVIVNRPLKRKHSYFCSEFVATVLVESGVHFFEKHPSLVTPDDFRKIEGIQHIYTGPLNEYNRDVTLELSNI